jgi:hypothetical protein
VIDDNGKAALLQRDDVPVVGQAFTVIPHCAEASTPITCNCGGAQTSLRVTTAHMTKCPSCDKVYQIAKLSYDGQTKRWAIQMAMGIKNKPIDG